MKRNNRWEVVGLTSWGYNEPGCGANVIPSVWVRVSYYEDWIDENMN